MTMFIHILDNILGRWIITTDSESESKEIFSHKTLIFKKLQFNQSIMGWYEIKSSRGINHHYSQVIPFVCRMELKKIPELHFQFAENLFTEHYQIMEFQTNRLFLSSLTCSKSLHLIKMDE